MAARAIAVVVLVTIGSTSVGQQMGATWQTAPVAAGPAASPNVASSPSVLLLPPPPPLASAPALPPALIQPPLTVPAHTPTVTAIPAQPPISAPTAASANPVVTYRPLVPIASMPPQYYVGRGLLGQPKLYVPNQPVRNFVRYLSP